VKGFEDKFYCHLLFRFATFLLSRAFSPHTKKKSYLDGDSITVSSFYSSKPRFIRFIALVSFLSVVSRLSELSKTKIPD